MLNNSPAKTVTSKVSFFSNIVLKWPFYLDNISPGGEVTTETRHRMTLLLSASLSRHRSWDFCCRRNCVRKPGIIGGRVPRVVSEFDVLLFFKFVLKTVFTEWRAGCSPVRLERFWLANEESLIPQVAHNKKEVNDSCLLSQPSHTEIHHHITRKNPIKICHSECLE